MTKADTLAKLQTLLQRVRARSKAPRHGAEAAQAGPIAAMLPEEPVQLTTWTPPPGDGAVDVDVDYVDSDQPPAAASQGDADATGGRLDSAERLVVAHSGPTGSDEPVAQITDRTNVPGADTEDAAPASSRRPVMLEPEDRLEQMAFGTEEERPPLHTPPPESGRLPAAPSNEFDSDEQGGPAMRPAHERVVAEGIRARLDPSAAVANVTGNAARAMPATFAALLDEALGL